MRRPPSLRSVGSPHLSRESSRFARKLAFSGGILQGLGFEGGVRDLVSVPRVREHAYVENCVDLVPLPSLREFEKWKSSGSRRSEKFTKSRISTMATNGGESSSHGRIGRSDKTADGYKTADVYLAKFLEVKGKPQLKDLSEEEVEGEHLEVLLEDLCYWFAHTNFTAGNTGSIVTKSKKGYLDKMKGIIQGKFKKHELFKNESWWNDLRSSFQKECDRTRILDENTTEERKSEPLYRDLKDDKSLLRAKYLDLSIVDARSVATSMLKSGGLKDIQDFLEFNINRQAVGRGGEHLFLRWDEAYWDSYFGAPDFDWKILKQLARQCMMFFHDKDLYCLDVFLAFGLYFLYGGLRRNPHEHSPSRANFVFPYLHNTKQDNVACHLTASIHANIEEASRPKKEFHFSLKSKGIFN